MTREMTREDRLYAMRGAELIQEAEKMGVKIAHKGSQLKESKAKAVAKILAADAEFEQELLEKAQEVVNAESTLSVPMPMAYDEDGPHLIEATEPIAESEPAAEPKRRGRKPLYQTWGKADEDAVRSAWSSQADLTIRVIRDGIIVKNGARRVAEQYVVAGGYDLYVKDDIAESISDRVFPEKRCHNDSFRMKTFWTGLTWNELLTTIREVLSHLEPQVSESADTEESETA